MSLYGRSNLGTPKLMFSLVISPWQSGWKEGVDKSLKGNLFEGLLTLYLHTSV